MPGGWSPETVERAKNVRLPEQIKCSGCQVARPQSAFSETQLARVRSKIAMQGQNAITRHPIRCQNCTGGGTPNEITCSRCRVEKPLASYTKAQRRDTEMATCKKCVSELMTFKTWKEIEESEVQQNVIADTTDGASSVVESSIGGVPLSVTTTVMPSSASQRFLSTSIHDYESMAGGAWLESDEDEPAVTEIEESATQTPSVNYSGWDLSSSIFKDVSREPQVPRASASTSSEGQKDKKGWAKVKSHDPFRNARILRSSDPTNNLPNKDKKENNDSIKTISGTKLNKKVREEVGAVSHQLSS